MSLSVACGENSSFKAVFLLEHFPFSLSVFPLNYLSKVFWSVTEIFLQALTKLLLITVGSPSPPALFPPSCSLLSLCVSLWRACSSLHSRWAAGRSLWPRPLHLADWCTCFPSLISLHRPALPDRSVTLCGEVTLRLDKSLRYAVCPPHPLPSVLSQVLCLPHLSSVPQLLLLSTQLLCYPPHSILASRSVCLSLIYICPSWVRCAGTSLPEQKKKKRVTITPKLCWSFLFQASYPFHL